MVASVQELIAAANAKYQRPPSKIAELSEIINSGFDTFNQARNQRMELTKQILQQKMLEQQIEGKKQMDALYEQDLKNGFNSVKEPNDPTRAGKFQREWKVDSSGNKSYTLKPVETKEPETMTPYQKESIALQKARLELDKEKSANKLSTVEEKEKSLIQGQVTQADLIINKVDQALGKVSGWSAGFGSKLSSIPTTDARDLAADIETIRANLGFQQLQDMRRSSPTGGALGQVSERELSALQSAVASLDQGQSVDQLKRNLNEIKKRYNNWKMVVAENQRGTNPAHGTEVGMITVSNGKETFEIPESDEVDAAADGFRRIP